MRSVLLSALCLAGLCIFSSSTPLKSLAAMQPQEVSAFLQGQQNSPFLKRLELTSAQALDTPYRLGPLGEGPGAPFDQKPLINFKEVDCVTFCEQSLALALAKDHAETVKILQKIRYKNGQIAMEKRNHYFMADWVPNNRWLVKDISASLPGHQWLSRTISHRQLFASQNFTGIEAIGDRDLKQAYLPTARLHELPRFLQPGDIGVLIQNRPGIFAAHTGFFFRQAGGGWVYRNATSIGPKKVVDTPYADLVASLQRSKNLIGIALVRPHARPKFP